MECLIQKVGNVMWYQYQVSPSDSCTFELRSGNVMYIRIRGNIDFETAVSALDDITKKLLQEGIRPEVNVKKRNHYLQCLLRRCNYQMIDAPKFSFNIWRYNTPSYC